MGVIVKTGQVSFRAENGEYVGLDGFVVGGMQPSVEVDATLTETGKAADAKAVGDKLTTFNNRISDLEERPLSGEDTVITYSENRTVYLGDELINGVTLSGGWSGSLESGLTHASGSTNILEFDTVTEAGESYCLEFDTTYGADEFVKVGIGDVYRTYVYNNRTHIIVFLYSDGGLLKIEPLSTFNGTLSNLSLKKVQETGTPLEVSIDLVANKEITSNNGFWNTLLGGNNALSGYGITRSIAIGNGALEEIKSGNRNIAIGTFALRRMQGGESNISIGSDSMYLVTQADGCVALGMGTMQYGKHESDLAFGFNALKGYGTDPVDTKYNIAIGIYAGYKNRANDNIFIGKQSGYNNTSGYSNIGIGKNALRLNTTGRQNIAIGSEANAKDQTSNGIIIGNNITTTKSNQVIIGSTSNTELVFLGNKKIVFNADGTVTWEQI